MAILTHIMMRWFCMVHHWHTKFDQGLFCEIWDFHNEDSSWVVLGCDTM